MWDPKSSFFFVEPNNVSLIRDMPMLGGIHRSFLGLRCHQLSASVLANMFAHVLANVSANMLANMFADVLADMFANMSASGS